MSVAPGPQSPAASLREEFDRAFAAPPAPAVPTEELLSIRVGGASYAVRLRDVAELVADLPVSPLPSTTPHLLGLVGVRAQFAGGVVPVFSLASLLGAAGGTALAWGEEAPRWLLLCAAHEPFALAFDGFEGHLRLPASALVMDPDMNRAPGAAGRFTRGFSRAPNASGGYTDRPLIDLPSIAAALRAQSDPARRTKEQ